MACIMSPARWSSIVCHTLRRLLAVSDIQLVGVEPNPGPNYEATPAVNTLHSVWSHQDQQYARSLTHLTINDEALDVTAVIETWVPFDAPDAVRQDLEPAGFKVIYKPCSDGHRDGRLAIICRDHLNIKTSLSFVPTTFKVLAMKLVIDTELFTQANIYRPPSSGIIQFTDELSDLDDVHLVISRSIILDDFRQRST